MQAMGVTINDISIYRNTQEIYIVSQYQMCIAIYRNFSFFYLNCSFFIHILSYSSSKSSRSMPVTFIALLKVFKQTCVCV